MADHAVNVSHHGTLPSAGGSDKVTCNVEGPTTANVYNRSSGDIFARMDGNNPANDGANDGDLVILAGSWRSFGNPGVLGVRVAGVNLTYSVEFI